MHLQKLQLSNFKNYEEVRVEFSEKINVLVGKNGSGKTNLLDAIHFLSLTKSAFSTDAYCIRQNHDFFFIKGIFELATDLREVSCSLQSGGKKTIKEGVNEYQKFSEHIGKYPVVLIAPDDTELVKEGSEERRRFFDSILSQLDKKYLEQLIHYTYALKQRNGLLKLFNESGNVDEIALESYDRILVQSGNFISSARANFLKEFLPVFQRYYSFLVENEPVAISYKSELSRTDFQKGLDSNRNRDILLQRTNFGIHRDDYQFQLGNGDLKRLGSQGQQKSFIIALKLAQFNITFAYKKTKPILLLDDIFDKLDDFRIAKLLQLITDAELGQLFISDARPDRTARLLEGIQIPIKVFKISNGNVEESA
jgi:DNA replication and repair protein RecF